MIKSIVTHDGKFHADEVLAVAVMLELFPDAEVIRTRDQEVVDAALNCETSIVIDVGGGAFDHHHKDFNLRRMNGDLYSSAGLVWKIYGESYVYKMMSGYGCTPDLVEEIAKVIDDRFIRYVDRHDNGNYPDQAQVGSTTFSSLISAMNPAWFQKEVNDEEDAFFDAVDMAMSVIFSLCKNVYAEFSAKTRVLSAIERQGNPEVLILDEGMPWKPHIKSDHRAVYVIHPNSDGNWIALGVEGSEIDSNTGRRNLKKPFPHAWRGLVNEELSAVVGIDGMVFCHRGRFILVAKDLSTISAAVQLALES